MCVYIYIKEYLPLLQGLSLLQASSKNLGAPQHCFTWTYCKLYRSKIFYLTSLRAAFFSSWFSLCHTSPSVWWLWSGQRHFGASRLTKLDHPTIMCWASGRNMIPFLFSSDKCCVKNKLPSVKNPEVCGHGSCTKEVLTSCYAKCSTLKWGTWGWIASKQNGKNGRWGTSSCAFSIPENPL